MYNIIEDASPFYVRFTYDGLAELINLATNSSEFKLFDAKNYTHKNFLPNISLELLNLLPMNDDFSFRKNRVASFLTPPGKCSSIHKDGTADRVSFNIPLQIYDDKCVTSWYSDDTFKDHELYGLPYSRMIYFNEHGYDRIEKAKTLIAKPNEMILFNVDIFHSWENNKSSNIREVLTFRLLDPNGLIFFDDVKKQLFP